MHSWEKIETEDDINVLFEIYYSFHDACIVSVSYRSGYYVEPDATMRCSPGIGHTLSVIFQSKMALKTLELLFTGLRQAHLVGQEYNQTSEIFEAHLSFANRLFPGEPERQIVWANYSDFSPDIISKAPRDPADTYIIANELKWRLLD